MIQHHAVADAGAAVVPNGGKAVETERRHDLHLILGHRPFGVGLVVLAPSGLALSP